MGRVETPFTWDMWNLIYKHSETTESVESYYKLRGDKTREFLGLRMRNLQDTVFTWTQTYWEIFKSALVYL